jgi:antitoxin component HigA of HigAB toxin-antitoxin module
MKSSLRQSLRALPRTFNDLNAIYPLRPIRDAVDLENAQEVMDRLAVLDRRTHDQNDYLHTLALLTEAFEAEQIEDALDPSKSSGLDALKYLMEAQRMKQTELAKVLGIGVSAMSMILSGDRPITADHARKLAKHFNVTAAAFL